MPCYVLIELNAGRAYLGASVISMMELSCKIS